MSEKCHCGREQSQQCSRLFDHLVSKREQLVRNLEAERLLRFEVDRQFKFGRLHDRQVGRLDTFENPTGIVTNLTVCLGTAEGGGSCAVSAAVTFSPPACVTLPTMA